VFGSSVRREKEKVPGKNRWTLTPLEKFGKQNKRTVLKEGNLEGVVHKARVFQTRTNDLGETDRTARLDEKEKKATRGEGGIGGS